MHEEVPAWLVEFQARVWAVQPVMLFQMVPPSAEYWKPTVPDAPAGTSEPGSDIKTDALRSTTCPDTETSGVAVIALVVLTLPTVSATLGEVAAEKSGSPE
jgi:hypothetical protein